MRRKILALSVVPLVVLTLVVMVFTMTMVKSQIGEDNKDTLEGVAVAVIAAYEQSPGKYWQDEEGIVWKGNYNISESEALVNSIKENSNVDVTFCYGKERVVTTVQDDEGNPIVGTEVAQEVATAVMEKGESVFSDNLLVGNEEYFALYIPIYQEKTSEIIGMVFAGIPVRRGLTTYYAILKMLSVVSIIFVLVFFILNFLSARSIAQSIQAVVEIVKSVAAGQLTVEISPKYLNRKDEIGSLSKAVEGMKNELRFIIEDIHHNTQELLRSADSLDGNAQSTLNTVGSVDRAVNEIADGATSQARDAIRVSENVTMMGDLLAATNQEIANLNDNAELMRTASSQATQSLMELMQINTEVMSAIERIYEQTNRTNQSSQKIREATNIISSISEETNLLSLNASIEAARAGEQGRGFAVVANEIQHLAEQSGASTDSITAMVNELIYDSNSAVDTMGQVKEIILSQSQNMERTRSVVEDVIRAIESSVQAIASIEHQSVRLNQAKDEIVVVVESLSAIAEENAASTEETSAATTEVANSFNEVTEAADALKHIADNIVGTMDTFKLE